MVVFVLSVAFAFSVGLIMEAVNLLQCLTLSRDSVCHWCHSKAITRQSRGPGQITSRSWPFSRVTIKWLSYDYHFNLLSRFSGNKQVTIGMTLISCHSICHSTYVSVPPISVCYANTTALSLFQKYCLQDWSRFSSLQSATHHAFLFFFTALHNLFERYFILGSS